MQLMQWRTARTTAGAFLLLFIALLSIILSILRPTVALAALLVVTAAVLARVLHQRWRRLSSRERSILAGVTACAIGIALAVVLSDPRAYYTVRPTVTVPYTLTASLETNGWRVHEEIRLDEKAVEQMRELPAPQDKDLAIDLPFNDEWRKDRLVDGEPIYSRDSYVPLQAKRIGLARARIDLPNLADGLVMLVPRSQSTVLLSAPRGAVAATTPPMEDQVITADGGGTVRTTVKLEDTTSEVTVAVLGSWLRSPLGQRFYDFSTWPPLPYLAGAVVLVLCAWCRNWAVERSRAAVAREDATDQQSHLHGGLRPVTLGQASRPSRRPRPVAGRRRQGGRHGGG